MSDLCLTGSKVWYNPNTDSHWLRSGNFWSGMWLNINDDASSAGQQSKRCAFFFFFFFQATVVCDLVLLYLLPKREFYKNMKFKYTDTHAQVRPAEWISCNITASTGGQQRVWGVRAKAGTHLLSAGVDLHQSSFASCDGRPGGFELQAQQQAEAAAACLFTQHSSNRSASFNIHNHVCGYVSFFFFEGKEHTSLESQTCHIYLIAEVMFTLKLYKTRKT